MATNLAAKNNIHLLSHSSVGENSGQAPSLTGFSAQSRRKPKLRCQPARAPIWRFWEWGIHFQAHLVCWENSLQLQIGGSRMLCWLLAMVHSLSWRLLSLLFMWRLPSSNQQWWVGSLQAFNFSDLLFSSQRNTMPFKGIRLGQPERIISLLSCTVSSLWECHLSYIHRLHPHSKGRGLHKKRNHWGHS